MCVCVRVFVGVRDLIHELALVYKMTALLCSLGVDGTCAGGEGGSMTVRLTVRLNACELILIQCFEFASLSQEL